MMKSLMMRVIPLFLVIPAACVIMLLSPMASAIALAEDDDSSLAKKLDLSLYGYVEASYTQNLNNPSTGVNNSRSFDGDANSFRPNMAQIVLEKVASSEGALTDRAGFRVKLNAGEDAKFTGGNTGADEFDFQEAYVQYIAPIENGVTFQAGRMNTLIGYEVIESPLNPNFSRSFLFGMGEPFTVTGFRASYDFNDSVSFAASAINSFTGLQADNNSSKSIEALLSLAPMDNVGISVFGFWGPEGARGQKDAERVQVGGIFDVQVTDQLELVLEGYYGNQANAGGPGTANARWNGVAGYFIYDFTDQWGLHVRTEVFEDAGGAFSCGGTPGGAGNALVCARPMIEDAIVSEGGERIPFIRYGDAMAAQTLWETTWTVQYKPVPNLITRAEFRYDKSDRLTFQDGAGVGNNQTTLAAEAIFLF